MSISTKAATGYGDPQVRRDPQVVRVNVTVPQSQPQTPPQVEEKKEVLSTAKKMYAIRHGVPFDAWFFNYIKGPKDTPWGEEPGLERKPCSARLWALWSLTESIILTTVESATYVMRRILFRNKADESWRNLEAQVSSVILSGVAVLSPKAAKEMFFDYWDDPTNRETYKREWETSRYVNAFSDYFSKQSI